MYIYINFVVVNNSVALRLNNHVIIAAEKNVHEVYDAVIDFSNYPLYCKLFFQIIRIIYKSNLNQKYIEHYVLFITCARLDVET